MSNIKVQTNLGGGIGSLPLMNSPFARVVNEGRGIASGNPFQMESGVLSSHSPAAQAFGLAKAAQGAYGAAQAGQTPDTPYTKENYTMPDVGSQYSQKPSNYTSGADLNYGNEAPTGGAYDDYFNAMNRRISAMNKGGGY